MCTVTYLPLGDDNFILTSNRDETPLRKTIPPKEYVEDGVKVIYPKDAVAGGTWIGTSEKNRVVCLLNGGFEKHERKPPYRMSRGIIVKNILTVDDPVKHIKNFDYYDIEPFTIILVDWNKDLQLHQLVWTGTEKHFKELSQEPQIWSSSPLYDNEMKELRLQWFADWLSKNDEFTQESILEFHKNDSLGTKETSPKMKRSFVETVSITSIKKNGELSLKYIDFLSLPKIEQKIL